MKKYTVLTGDIVNSRKINDFKSKLTDKLQNIKYPDTILAPFNISQGDEIQCALEGCYYFTRFIRRVRYILNPFDIYFGIGIGEIEEGLTNENSWQMNGSAFYRARKALDSVKSKQNYSTKLFSPKESDQTINTIQYLLDIIQRDWTEAQWKAIHLYEKLGTYKKAAKELEIAYQNVQKRCKAAKWDKLQFAENNLENIFNNLFMLK